MKVPPLLPLMFWLLCGCTPNTSGPTPGSAVARAAGSRATSAAANEQAAMPGANAASYEVSIASAEADRVQAVDLCGSKVKAARPGCIAAADAAYDQAKSAAQSARSANP
jgi:hypothetical protein